MNLQDKEDYLQHYGVLGMKWGKRKDRSSGSSRKSALGMKWGRRKDNHKYVVKNRNGSPSDFAKNKNFKTAAKSLNERSKKVNDAYSEYLKALTNSKNYSKKAVDSASAKHMKEAYELRKEADTISKKLLGRYGNKRLDNLYTIDYVSGKLKRSETTRNILSQALTNISLDDTTTSKQDKQYKKFTNKAK